MKKYKFLFICTFLVFLGVLTESLKKNPSNSKVIKYIMIEPKVRFSPNGTPLFVSTKEDTIIITTQRFHHGNFSKGEWVYDSLLLAKFVK